MLLEFAIEFKQKIQDKIDIMSKQIGIDCDNNVDNNNTDNNNDNKNNNREPEQLDTTIYNNFKLPIAYLDVSTNYSLSPIVSSDLELVPTENNKCMYDYLFLPKHTFAKQMIQRWKTQYTTNTDFLNDSQTIIKNLSDYKMDMNTTPYEVDCERILKIWKEIKQNESFLDKYGYMDWDMLSHLNKSSTFLQALSVINISSPVISLVIPILFIIFPFILLKIQGIPITFAVYLDVLKGLAKNHFIGKTLCSLESLSWDKIVYLIFTFGLYILQIYQNVTQCFRFYRNIHKINESILFLRDYTKYSVRSMNCFLEIAKSRTSYQGFCKDVEIHRDYLNSLTAELDTVAQIDHGILKTAIKFGEVGNMLKCYYSLYSNRDYEMGLRYSCGFEGFINNLMGVHMNVENQRIHFAEMVLDKPTCDFKKQYYPPLLDESPIKNDCAFDKNMIISAPNKSGKTTILKSTTINIIFTQQVGCGFYDSAKLTPYTHIHSYLNIPDTSGRDSLFQAESRRCKEILDIIKVYNGEQYRHFCIFDELYSGTNPDEASKSGYAFLKYLANFGNVNFILTTHYVSICKKFKDSEHIQNYKMGVNVLDNGKFEYTYKIKKGISKIKGAVRVLKDMDYPGEIIDTIENQDKI
jgi:hypothetical protein